MPRPSSDSKAILREFQAGQAALVLEALREILDLSEIDKPLFFIVEVDFLIERAAIQSARRDPEGFFDQKEARKISLNLFRQLQAAGLGRLIVGRRKHPTRLRLSHNGSRELLISLRELGIGLEYALPLDPPGQPAVSLERPTRESVVANLKAHQAEIRKFGVLSLELFGSVARNEGKPGSDVDLLVTFKGPVTSDGFFGVKFFLEDLLKRPIDLVTDASLREPMRRAIKAELISVA